MLDLARSFNTPVTDSKKERERVADTLNKIYIESLDNKALGSVLKTLGGDPEKLGTNKRLQSILEKVARNGEDVSAIMLPFFTAYDFRVAALHLTSAETARDKLKTVTDRLKLPENATLVDIQNALVDSFIASFKAMKAIIETAQR